MIGFPALRDGECGAATSGNFWNGSRYWVTGSTRPAARLSLKKSGTTTETPSGSLKVWLPARMSLHGLPCSRPQLPLMKKYNLLSPLAGA